jgi:hypothetical protein
MAIDISIDIGALHSFQNAWGPILTAIPAVINMAEQQADLNRALAAKRLELTAASDEIDAAFKEANSRLVVLNQEMTKVLAQKADVMASIEAATVAAAKAAQAAEVAAKAKLAETLKTLAARSEELAAMGADIDAKAAAASAAHANAVAVRNVEIQDLEKRKAAAEKALDTLRSRLG